MAFEATFQKRDIQVGFYQHPDATAVSQYRLDYDCGGGVVTHTLDFSSGALELITQEIVDLFPHLEPYLDEELLYFTDTLTFAENDGANPTSTANRTVGIRILTKSADGKWTEDEAQILSGSAFNPAPTLTTAPKVSSEFEKALIQITPPDEPDVVGYLVHLGKSADFLPSGGKAGEGNCISSGPDTNISTVLDDDEDTYFKVGPVDSFGSDLINYLTIGPVSRTVFDPGDITQTVNDIIGPQLGAINANIDAANEAIDGAVESFNGQLTVINGKLTVIDQNYGAVGSRFIVLEDKSDTHASKISAIETVVGTSDSLGLRARILAAENTLVNLDTQKASASSVSNLQTEITNARNGKANLAAELGSIRTATVDGLAGKASTADLATLTARVTSAEGENTAQNTRLNTVESDIAGKASAAEVSTLRTEVQNARNGKANLNAELTAIRTATSDGLAGKASASDLAALTTRVGTTETTNTAQNTRLNTVESDLAGKASATSVSNLQTEITNARGGSANLSARFTAVSQTIVDGLAGKASASSVSSLSSTVDGYNSRITNAETVAAAADGKASATKSVVLGAGNKVAGFQISATQNSSNFEIIADNFRLTPSNGAAGVSPFEVIGNTVYMKNTVWRSAATGARTEQDANGMRVYDANRLRVRVGGLVMPAGLECWDASGKQTFSTNTMTTRIFGQRVAGQNYYERFIVPVSPGKRLWFYHYVRGTVRAYMFLDGYVDPSLNIPNRVTLQVDPGGTGEAYFFWGEY